MTKPTPIDPSTHKAPPPPKGGRVLNVPIRTPGAPLINCFQWGRVQLRGRAHVPEGVERVTFLPRGGKADHVGADTHVSWERDDSDPPDIWRWTATWEGIRDHDEDALTNHLGWTMAGAFFVTDEMSFARGNSLAVDYVQGPVFDYQVANGRPVKALLAAQHKLPEAPQHALELAFPGWGLSLGPWTSGKDHQGFDRLEADVFEGDIIARVRDLDADVRRYLRGVMDAMKAADVTQFLHIIEAAS